MTVIKRDCSEVDFDKSKISTAILKAMKNGSGIVKPKIADDIAKRLKRESQRVLNEKRESFKRLDMA